MIGYWLESKAYADRELIPKNETPELIEGSVQVRFDLISHDKEIYINNTTSRKSVYQIEIKKNIDIKQYDYFYIDKWYMIKSVSVKLPKDKQNIVRNYPAQFNKHAIRTVELE